jgi:hypothetical protein
VFYILNFYILHKKGDSQIVSSLDFLFSSSLFDTSIRERTDTPHKHDFDVDTTDFINYFLALLQTNL